MSFNEIKQTLKRVDLLTETQRENEELKKELAKSRRAMEELREDFNKSCMADMEKWKGEVVAAKEGEEEALTRLGLFRIRCAAGLEPYDLSFNDVEPDLLTKIVSLNQELLNSGTLQNPVGREIQLALNYLKKKLPPADWNLTALKVGSHVLEKFACLAADKCLTCGGIGSIATVSKVQCPRCGGSGRREIGMGRKVDEA
ncbi:MAG: hypothetical protein ABSB28_10550 [Candidatus Bathyarchaeia archaeon]